MFHFNGEPETENRRNASRPGQAQAQWKEHSYMFRLCLWC